MTSTRWCWPGTYFDPAGPTPPTSPKETPFLAAQHGPAGPSARWGGPGTSFAPAGPPPPTSPKETPFLAVQNGPSGPSVTYGIRSFMGAEAPDVKRSGGTQGRSMWQSAEMRV